MKTFSPCFQIRARLCGRKIEAGSLSQACQARRIDGCIIFYTLAFRLKRNVLAKKVAAAGVKGQRVDAQPCGLIFSVPFGQCGLNSESEMRGFRTTFEYRTME